MIFPPWREVLLRFNYVRGAAGNRRGLRLRVLPVAHGGCLRGCWRQAVGCEAAGVSLVLRAECGGTCPGRGLRWLRRWR
jgi:hypothetical protein